MQFSPEKSKTWVENKRCFAIHLAHFLRNENGIKSKTKNLERHSR